MFPRKLFTSVANLIKDAGNEYRFDLNMLFILELDPYFPHISFDLVFFHNTLRKNGVLCNPHSKNSH